MLPGFFPYHGHHIKKYTFSSSKYFKTILLKPISNQGKATKETVAILITAVVLKMRFPVNCGTSDFSSCQKEHSLSEMNDVSSISRASQEVQNKVWQENHYSVSW